MSTFIVRRVAKLVARSVGVGFVAFGVAAMAPAQVPDVRIKLDVLYNLRAEQGGATSARFYDSLGNRALMGVTLFLETGMRAYFSQRLQQIRNDPDQDPFDEYYIEDPGLWRVGKQYLPFGSRRIIRESALGVEGDTNLIVEGLPIVAELCDGGPGLQRGVVGRIGGRIGFSFAFGQHFGIGATSLNYVRSPEESPGKGAGYRQMFGVDFSKTFHETTVRGEAVVLRQGETAADFDEDVVDVSVSVGSPRTNLVGLGVTHSTAQERTFYRVEGTIGVMRNLALRPVVRFVDGRLFDANLAFQVRF